MKKILIIDDDEAILDVLDLALTDAGFKIKIVDKPDCLAKNTFKPDLVIIDLLLAGVDGREVVKRLKRANKTKKTPVLMISAHPWGKQMARQAGADSFVAKPFDLDFLVDKINSLMVK